MSCKLAIVLLASGSASPDAPTLFHRIATRVQACWPAAAIRWAFTAESLMLKLRQNGFAARSLQDVLADVQSDGCDPVIIQPFTIAGTEVQTGKPAPTQSAVRITVGKPLLDSARDLDRLLDCMEEEEPALLNPSLPVVFAAHGSEHNQTASAVLKTLDTRIRKRYAATWLGSLHGQPGTAPLAEAKAFARDCGRIHFIPLMLTAGTHVTRDIMGDGPEAWKTRIGAAETTCAKPLGQRDKMIDLFVNHLRTASGEKEI